MSEEILGFQAKFYRNTGTDAVPVWVLMDRIRDVSVPMDKAEANSDRRGSKFKFKKGAMLDTGIELEYLFRKGTDADFDALLDSYLNGTEIQFAVMDQLIATSGAQGLKMFGEVKSFPFEQPLEDNQTFDVTIMPTATEEASALVEPSWEETP